MHLIDWFKHLKDRTPKAAREPQHAACSHVKRGRWGTFEVTPGFLSTPLTLAAKKSFCGIGGDAVARRRRIRIGI